MHNARWAALLAGAASIGLMAVVVVRQVGFNALNGWTITIGLVACVVLAQAERPRDAEIGAALLIIGLAPALFGGMGLLYVPSVVFAVIAANRMRRPRQLTS